MAGISVEGSIQYCTTFYCIALQSLNVNIQIFYVLNAFDQY